MKQKRKEKERNKTKERNTLIFFRSTENCSKAKESRREVILEQIYIAIGKSCRIPFRRYFICGSPHPYSHPACTYEYLFIYDFLSVRSRLHLFSQSSEARKWKEKKRKIIAIWKRVLRCLRQRVFQQKSIFYNIMTVCVLFFCCSHTFRDQREKHLLDSPIYIHDQKIKWRKKPRLKRCKNLIFYHCRFNALRVLYLRSRAPR